MSDYDTSNPPLPPAFNQTGSGRGMARPDGPRLPPAYNNAGSWTGTSSGDYDAGDPPLPPAFNNAGAGTGTSSGDYDTGDPPKSLKRSKRAAQSHILRKTDALGGYVYGTGSMVACGVDGCVLRATSKNGQSTIAVKIMPINADEEEHLADQWRVLQDLRDRKECTHLLCPDFLYRSALPAELRAVVTSASARGPARALMTPAGRTLGRLKDATEVYVLGMPFISEPNLKIQIESGQFEHVSAEEVRDLFVQLMSGVDVLYRAGYAHRDLTPDNLFWLGRKHLLISDFGSLCRNDGVGGTDTRGNAALHCGDFKVKRGFGHVGLYPEQFEQKIFCDEKGAATLRSTTQQAVRRKFYHLNWMKNDVFMAAVCVGIVASGEWPRLECLPAGQRTKLTSTSVRRVLPKLTSSAPGWDQIRLAYEACTPSRLDAIPSPDVILRILRAPSQN